MNFYYVPNWNEINFIFLLLCSFRVRPLLMKGECRVVCPRQDSPASLFFIF
ncbi:hypothetical protein CIT292_10838 [Citrobacter youngae ATCC 29220]|uniref:Uncharacterized protein n=1 Tax=Citrobacter youngae ATCC 29220 TaxID=500640 RepID=D4BJJ5_9ENTR|nr:hypothetical protein CIT292_10838 [Citrobacter youngae ATCC 29220]